MVDIVLKVLMQKNRFKSPPKCLFEFDSCNLDDPDEAATVFGVSSLEPSFVGSVEVLKIRADESDNVCCLITATVDVRFQINNQVAEIEAWLNDHSSELDVCGRITCEGEDGLDGSDEEGFTWPWDH
jgi:hypothetical protein